MFGSHLAGEVSTPMGVLLSTCGADADRLAFVSRGVWLSIRGGAIDLSKIRHAMNLSVFLRTHFM
jgi:hypothetical protein